MSHETRRWALRALVALVTSSLSMAALGRSWESLNDEAVKLFRDGKYSEGIVVAREALSVAESMYGPDDTRVSTSLNNLAVLYDNQGQYADAEPLYERGLAIREKALGPEHPDVAQSLHNLAVTYLKQGRYTDAERLTKRSMAIWEKTLGSEHSDVAESLLSLAEIYRLQGKYTEAEPLYKRSLDIREKTFGPEHPKVATSLDKLGMLYVEQGRYAEAESLYKRSLAIWERTLGPEDPHVATSLNNLATVYRIQGKYADAEPLYKRSLAIREKALGLEHPDVALTLNNLAVLYDTQGKYAEAESLYKRSLAIWERTLGPEDPHVATSLNNLATVYRIQGKYADAEPLYKRSLAIREKALGPEHPDVATSLGKLGVLYEKQGRYSDAEPLHKRSLAIREKALGLEHPDVALSLNDLAVLYDTQGRYAEAEPLYKRSLAIWENSLGPEHPDVATSLNNLAVFYKRQGKYLDAEPLYKRSLAIQENALGPEHPSVATALGNLGVLYEEQGKFADAESLYKRNLQILEDLFGPTHPDVGTSLVNLATLRYAQRKEAEAESLFKRVFENLTSQFEYHFTYMSENDRLAFLETVSGYFPLYYSFCLTYYEKIPELVGMMYDAVLWQKSVVAGSMAAMRTRIVASGDLEGTALLDEIGAKKTQAAQLLSVVPKERDSWKKRVAKLEGEINELERALVARSAMLSEDKRLARARWQDVQMELKSSEAAVEFLHFRLRDRKRWTAKTFYVALILIPDVKDGPRLIVLGEDDAVAGSPLKEYRQQLGLGGKIEGGGSSLYQAVWKPLEAALGGATRVYVSPDGVLNQVALGVVSIDSSRTLMDAYDIRTVSSTRDLLRRGSSPSAAPVVLVGNPEFSIEDSSWTTAVASLRAKTATGTDVTSLSNGSVSGELRGRSLKPLPGTQEEVDAIASMLRERKQEVLMYDGRLALEEAVKGVKRPRVLHIATHGFFRPDQERRGSYLAGDRSAGWEDPMLRSGLFLTGAGHALSGSPVPAALEDGVLTAYEATVLDLQGTELVVLSACETGLGETRTGEGVFGLRRAFQVAGAEAVLMSMWSVPDEETRELMGLFYEGWLSGKEKHLALRDAQMETRNRIIARYGKDRPGYWGAFVLVGR